MSSREYLAALEEERARVEPFDFAVLAARAVRLDDPPPRRAPAPAPWWRRLLVFAPVLVVAALLFVSIRPPAPNREKGDTDLGFYLLRDNHVLPGDPHAVFRDGDRVQITYRGPYDRLVLLSVDGTGHVSVYYPQQGNDSGPVVPGERHVLDFSVLLDDAPGPEVFLGFFGEDWSLDTARALAARTYASGGAAALARLAEQDPTVAILSLEKE